MPRLPHQAVPGAVRRLHLEGGLPGADRPDHRVPVRAATAASSASWRTRCARRPRRRSSSGPPPSATACAAVRHLMERQFATAGSVGTADVLGVAIEDDSANVQVLQVRDGVLQDRQSFFLETSGADDEATVLRAVRVRVLRDGPRDPAAGDRGAGERGRRGAGGAAVRAAGQPASRCAPPRAATSASWPSWPTRNARFALDQDRRRHEQARGRRREALADLQDAPRAAGAAGARSSATTSRTSARPTPSPRWWCSRAGRRPAATTAPSRCATTAAPTTSPACEEALRRRFSRLAEPGEDDVSFAARPGLVVIDGGKGQLRRRAGRHARGGGRPTCRS